MRTWQGCIAKDDDAAQPESLFNYLEVQRWDVVMRQLWGKSGWLNSFDSVSDANCPNNLVSTDEDMYEYPKFNDFPGGGGGPVLYKIQGITKDSAGNPLGDCRVELFRTSDDLRVDEVISDAAGNYLLYTPYIYDMHYCVSYKDPNLTGATVRTLTGVA